MLNRTDNTRHPCLVLDFIFYIKKKIWSSCCGSVIMNLTSIYEDAGSVPGLAQWVKGSGLSVSCGVGCSQSWLRSQVAVALV